MEFLSSDVNRRVFVKGVGVVTVGLLLGTLGGCEQLAEAIRNRPMRRRLRTGSAAVDADIATYRHAVELMKALPASDPTSWTAQAAIHGSGAGFNFCQHGTDHFFDWHRAYLFYFEKICQKVTGNAHFGLPYWNWNQNPDIHPAFLNPAGTLFLARNRTSMSGNTAVSTATLDGILADTNFFTFRQQIEGTPHNTVHTYIGGTMGSGASALDPLFWTHHCMVDYAWTKWNLDLGNDNPNDPAWTTVNNQHFVTAQGQIGGFTAGVTTIMPLLSYQYESSAIGSSPATGVITNKAAFEKVEKRVRDGANIRFDIRQRVRIAEKVPVSIARPVSRETTLSAADFTSIINGDARHQRVFVSVGFAALPVASDFAVRVFVNLPTADAKTPIDDPHYAGSFAFFGTSTVAATPGAAMLHEHAPQFLVNVTDTLTRLTRRQELKPGAPLTFQLVAVPFGDAFERADTTLLLEQLDLIVTPVIINSARP